MYQIYKTVNFDYSFCRSLYKQWNGKYETLTSMVVPRSSVKIAEDDEFGLFTVTLFKRVADEFGHKAREEKYVV